MHKWHPYFISKAYPKRWAEECQNAIFPFGSLKSKNSILQSPSNGRPISNNYDEFSSWSSHASTNPYSIEF